MLRRLVSAVGLVAVAAIPSSSAEAQFSVDFSPFSTQFRGISESSIGLLAYGPGGPYNLNLSVHDYNSSYSGNPYALIGRPSAPVDYDYDGIVDDADGTTYGFGSNGQWKNTTGVFLNSGEGTLRFDFVDFSTTFIRVFMQFGTICHDIVDAGDDVTCDDEFFGWPPRIRGYRADDTYVEYAFTHDDIGSVHDVDVGRYYTLDAGAGAGFVRFEASGQFVAVGGMEILPEPGSIALLATGLIGMGVVVRRRRTK